MRVYRGLAAALLFGLTAVAQNGVRRPGGFVPGQQRPPGDPAADRARKNPLRHQLHRLSWRGPSRRRSGRAQPAAVAGCSERSGWRIDSPHHSGQPAEPGHAGHRHESGRTQGGGRLCSQRGGDHRNAGHAAIGRAGTAQRAGRRRERRPGLLRREMQRLPFRHRRSEGIATRIPIPKRCRTRWVAGGARSPWRRADARTLAPVTVTITLRPEKLWKAGWFESTISWSP